MATGGQAEISSDVFIEYQCVVCETRNKAKKAAHYCFDCQKYLCDDCLSIHNTFSNKHPVLAVTDDTFKAILTERCGKHPDEVIKYFCQHHDAVLCSTCERVDHRKCEDLKYISESVDELSLDQKLQEIPDHLQSALDHVSLVIDVLEKRVLKVADSGNAYLTYLEDYTTKLLSKIKDCKTKGTNEMTHTQNAIIAASLESSKACKRQKEIISKCIEDIKRSEKREAHAFVLKKKGQYLLLEAENLCREAERMIIEKPFYFRIDQMAESLRSFTLASTKYTITQTSCFNLKIPVDNVDCGIWSCCCLYDGMLVLTDNRNKRLKRVDPFNNQVTDFCLVSGHPCGVCSTGLQEVVFADHSNIIHYFSTGKGLITTRSVEMSNRVAHLAYHGGELYAGREGLWVYDVTGKLIRDISRDAGGNEVYCNITGITVNGSGDRLYVSDWFKGLFCIAKGDGRILFHLDANEIGVDKACGVATDHLGNVMVAGRDSNNIVQVTEEGMVLGEILSKKDGICLPECLAYDGDRRRLYVGGQMSQLMGYDLF